MDPTPTTRKIESRKPLVKRIIAENPKIWKFTDDELTDSAQRNLIFAIQNAAHPTHETFVKHQIQRKIYGYMTQDIDSGRYNHTKLVKPGDIIQSLCDCQLLCFYCTQPVMILYEYAREPRQWTVERVDNTYGHIRDNFVIACLQCNLRRRTILPERYLLTKTAMNVHKLA